MELQLNRYFYGKGIRKTSRAFCKLYADNKGLFFINSKSGNLDQFLNLNNDSVLPAKQSLLDICNLYSIDLHKDFSFNIKTYGGGKFGSQSAIIYAISKSLLKYLSELHEPKQVKANFRKYAFLDLIKIDNRIKECKKIGKTKARKSKPYVKR